MDDTRSRLHSLVSFVPARLAAILDNTSATICITGKAGSLGFQACQLVLVKNKGLR